MPMIALCWLNTEHTTHRANIAVAINNLIPSIPSTRSITTSTIELFASAVPASTVVTNFIEH